MKIKKITIDNIRCFKHLEIDLNSEQNSKNWIIILGDNGVGKTTILRSLALGLTEESGASGLLPELEGSWIRYGCEEGSIRIDIEPYPECKEKASITTKIKINTYKEVEVRQIVSPKEPETFLWDDLFICAYGPTRSQDASVSYEDYVITDSIYTLFKYSSMLQNPELNIRRIKSLNIDERLIFDLLEPILMLPKGAITLDFSGIKVSGPWGKKIPLGALGDGYYSTINWIIDMIGWKALYEGSKPGKLSIDNILNISGIILLDEIEQHLHPKWQKSIIKLLKDKFPNLQFIVTTHSPLAVIGTTELDDDDCSIVVLEQKDNFVENRIASPPRRKRVDQVLTSYMFDLYTASDDAIKHDIEKYQHLYQIERTKEEEKEMQLIIQKLDEQLDSAETELEKLVEVAVQQTLDNLSEDYNKTEKSDLKPSHLELRRQLKQLFN